MMEIVMLNIHTVHMERMKIMLVISALCEIHRSIPLG